MNFLIEIGVNCAELSGKHLLATFLSGNSMELKKLLLSNGSNPNGRYLLHKSVLDINFLDCELLLEYGADINLCRNQILECINSSLYREPNPKKIVEAKKIIDMFREKD